MQLDFTLAHSPHNVPQAPGVSSGPVTVKETHSPLGYADMAVDTEDLHLHANFSGAGPPHPNGMKQPPPLPQTYYAVTAGEKVGISNNLNDLNWAHIPVLPYFSMAQFSNWDAAYKYYSDRFYANDIHLVSNNQPLITGAAQGTPSSSVSQAGVANAMGGPHAGIGGIAISASVASHPASESIIVPCVTATVPGPRPASASTLAIIPTNAPNPPTSVPTTIPGPAVAALTKFLTNVDSGDPYAGALNSPFGGESHPIPVSSTFPTPEPAIAIQVSAPQPLSGPPLPDQAAFARRRQMVLAARVSPSSGRSGSSKRKKNISKRTKSTAATRVRRKGKGKGKEKATAADEDMDPFVYVYETDGSAVRPGPSSRMKAYTLPPPPPPMITVTAPTPATPVVDPVSASSSGLSIRYNPFHNSPFNLPTTVAPTTPQRHSVMSNSPSPFEQLVQNATETPKSVGSQRRLALIELALMDFGSSTPPCGVSTPSSVAWATPTSGISTPIPTASSPGPPGISTPIPTASSPGPAARATSLTPAPGTPAGRFAAIREAFENTSPGPLQTPSHRNRARSNRTPDYLSTPETEYGLSSDFDPDFLNEAAPLLDRVYSKPSV